ncbi:MAG: GNAT family N-acetyltransferase, partial [Nannocystaceae bacterium]
MLPRATAVETSPSDPVRLFASREPWTQSLAYVAGLQDRGWACLLAGGAVLAVQPGRDGPSARMQRPQVIDVPQIDAICSRLPLRSLRVEPALQGVIVDRDGRRHRWDYDRQRPCFEPLLELGWRPAQRLSGHTKTRVIDLRPELPQVVQQFSSVARRNTRAALARDDVQYVDVSFHEASNEQRAALQQLDEQFRRTRPKLRDEWAIRSSIATHLGPKGRYLLALHQTQLVGAVYLVMHDRVGSYFVAQATETAKALRVPTGLVHATMAVAREHGCDLLDFVGVHDERFPHALTSWAGFTAFKERFGGQPVYLPPALEVPLPG